MAVAFRSIDNTTYASRTNTTVTAPAGIVDDDILLLFGLTAAATASETMTPPAGFSAVSLASGTNPTTVVDGSSFNLRVWAWWKRAASESGDYTITHASNNSQGACIAISGAIASGDPVDAATSHDESAGAGGATSTGDAVTTTVADTLLVFFGHDWADTGNDLTAPTGMTERLDVAPLVYAATQDIAATGSTGNRTMTNNSSGAQQSPWATYMIAIKPPAVGGGLSIPIAYHHYRTMHSA